jgi:arylamine N-acetyltransferase
MSANSSAANVARSRAAEAFLDHLRILPRGRSQDLLWEVREAFARLPYENLTKLIKKHATPDRTERRRLPGEVVLGHVERGTGGTCFALTETFLSVLDRLGYRSRPVLCDMRAGVDSHCAVWIDASPGGEATPGRLSGERKEKTHARPPGGAHRR